MRVSLRHRLVLFGLLTAEVWSARVWFDRVVRPAESPTDLAVRALNGDAAAVRSYESGQDLATWAAVGMTAAGFCALVLTYPGRPTTSVIDRRTNP